MAFNVHEIETRDGVHSQLVLVGFGKLHRIIRPVEIFTIATAISAATNAKSPRNHSGIKRGRLPSPERLLLDPAMSLPIMKCVHP